MATYSTTGNSNICCVHGCRNKQSNEKLSFFPLPRDPERRAVWLRVIGRNDLEGMDETRARVCSKHFGKTDISELMAQKLMPNAIPTRYLPTSLYLSPLIYEHDEGISDMATQTDITYGYTKPEKDVFVEIFGRTVLIKKEKNPEKPKLSTFMLDRPVKREPGVEIGESSKKKKRN